MRDLVIMLIVLGSIPAIFVRPWFGIIVWCWIGFMNPHRMAWGFAYEFPFAMLIGIVTLIAIVFSKEKYRIPMSTLAIVWLAWILWMNVSTIFALDVAMSALEWERTMKIQLFVVLTTMLITERYRLRWLLWVTVVSIGFFGVKGGIFAITTGGNYRVYGPPGGFFTDNNAVGLALIMVVPLMWYLRTEFSKKTYRLICVGCVGLTAMAVLATHSRGALLASGFMVSFLWLKSKNKAILAVILILAIPVMLGMMPEAWWDRMASIKDYEQDGSAMGRINAWWFAFNLASDHPLTGGGFGTFTKDLFLRYAPIPDDHHDAHSIYFEVLAEHGFVGIGLFLLLGFTAMRTAGRTASRARNVPSLAWAADLARMCQVSLIGYAVGGLFLGLAYFDLYYHIIALVIITRAIVVREIAAIATVSGAATSGGPVASAAPTPPPGSRPGDRFVSGLQTQAQIGERRHV